MNATDPIRPITSQPLAHYDPAVEERVTGWLLPADAQDTDIACGVMQGEVYILGVQDKATGRRQTLMGERQTEATA